MTSPASRQVLQVMSEVPYTPPHPPSVTKKEPWAQSVQGVHALCSSYGNSSMGVYESTCYGLCALLNGSLNLNDCAVS